MLFYSQLALEDLATSDKKGSLEDYVISKEAVKKLDETSHNNINIDSTKNDDDDAQWVKIKKKVHSKSYKNTFFDIFKSAKTHFLLFQKWQKINFCTRKKYKTTKNAIFGLFSGAKIDFLPFLKMQIMFFCTFEIALFSNFRALWEGGISYI